jgi:MFS family permease
LSDPSLGATPPEALEPSLLDRGAADAASTPDGPAVGWLRALYLFNGLGSGALYLFLPVLLQAKGFEPVQIGLTVSLASLAFALTLPIWGHLGDAVIGRRRALQLGLIPVAVVAFGFNLDLPAAALAACWVAIMASSPIYSLTDSIAMATLRDAPRKYTRVRLMAPIGMASGSILFGYLYGAVGYWLVPICSAAALIGTFICAQLLPSGHDNERTHSGSTQLGDGPSETPQRRLFGSPGRALRLRPALIPALAAATILFMAFPIVNTYLGLRIVNLGGGPELVGLTNGIGFSAQIPGMLVAGLLVARLGPQRVLVASAFGFSAATLGFIVFENIPLIIMVRFIAELCHSAAFIALVLAIARMLPSRLQATGQTLTSATCFGIGPIVATFTGGILYSDHGALGVFGLAAVCALVGGILVLFALSQREAQVAHA